MELSKYDISNRCMLTKQIKIGLKKVAKLNSNDLVINWLFEFGH